MFMRCLFLKVTALSLFFSFFTLCAQADYSQHKGVQAFVDSMVTQHQFDRKALEDIFSQAEKKESILKAIARPAEKRLEWKGYRKIFLTKDRIKKGKAFLKEHAETFARAEAKYGVPKNIIASIIGVETRYGHNKGSYRVVDALSTLAFDYPPRSKFFKSELEQAFLLAREQGFKALDLTGSYAGAMGFGQFIPSSYRHYAVDFDEDKVADILDNPVDSIGSVANYFAEHKWQSGQPVTFKIGKQALGDDFSQFINKKLKPKFTLADLKTAGVAIPSGYDLSLAAKIQKLQGKLGEEYWVTLGNFYVITRYNHSHLYAMAVHQLAEELR
jgi:membrane-bound lytic murein transglycosylase B